MAVKTILVHVDDTERGAARVDLAAGLARTHGAHLIGLAVNAAAIVPAFVGAEIPAQVWQLQIDEMAKHVDAAGEMFKKAVKKAGVAHEWRVLDQQIGDIARVVSQHARHADLTILGQPDPDRNGRTLSLDVVERVVLDAGGPVLVIPYAGTFASVGRRVMLAWNGSREACRALHDATAVLDPKAEIVVMNVNPPGAHHAERDVAGVDIAAAIARHGYKAEVAHVIAEDMKVGDIILSRASDAGADMIVMGAYGHSRLRELVLGGATEYVLNHMTVPVLMSH